MITVGVRAVRWQSPSVSAAWPATPQHRCPHLPDAEADNDSDNGEPAVPEGVGMGGGRCRAFDMMHWTADRLAAENLITPN